VADTYRVIKFASDGTPITTWGSYGSAIGQFDHPHGITVDEWGNVYVADTWNHRVQKFGACDPVILTENLIVDVERLNVNHGIANSLDVKLAHISEALEDVNEHNDGAAIGRLQAFINEIEAQSGKNIPVQDADALIATAERIIISLTE
jgi:DNA-binding beta-propeller fold protein YncE